MKNSMIKAGALAITLFAISTLAPSNAFAQQGGGRGRNNLGQVVSGLINVNVGAINILEGGINVTDVLNDAEINVLSNLLNRSPILSNNQDVLNNLLQGSLNDVLRDADIITENQVAVIVGVLSGIPVFQVQDLDN